MNLELFLSYSLQDFLLFSPETWWLLYSEFARRVWILPLVLLTFLVFALLSNKPKTHSRLYLMMTVQMLLLASCIYYYLDFYLQINEFARYLVFVCALQCLIVAWHFLFVFITDSNEEAVVNVTSSVEKDSDGGRNGNKSDYILVALSLFAVALFVKTEQNMFLLPGSSALSSLFLFLFLTRFYFRLNLIRLVPALILIAVEIMTLYSMSQQYWWLPLLMFLVTILRPFRLPTFQ